MIVLEWSKLIPSEGFKRGELVYHIADFTPSNRGKSWVEKMLQMSIAARCGGKTHMAMRWWEDGCIKLFPPKQTKLLQSKSKCPRIVRVVIK